ncbi:MAG: vWA domain-containing protein, partial [Acidimicrobiales bacterium]
MNNDWMLRLMVGSALFIALFALVLPPLGAQETTTTTEPETAPVVEEDLLIERTERDPITGEVIVEVIAPIGLAGDTEIPENAVLVLLGNAAQNAAFESIPADDLEVMLVLDISGSMRGEALDAAKAAAVSFVDLLPEGVEVGVVSFDNETYLNAPLDIDHVVARDAIDALEVGGDTALFDAIDLAAKQFVGPNGAARRVVVILTDGADSASTTTLENAQAALLTVGAEPFAMALATNETATDTLEALVDGTEGRLDRVENTEALTPLYNELAAKLASRFTVRFTPTATRAAEATILLNHNGTSASASAAYEGITPPAPSTTVASELAAEGDSDPWFGPQTFSAPLTEFAQTKAARNLGIAMVASVLLIAGLLISFPPSAVVNMAQSGRDRAVAGASVADLTGRLEDAADKALNNKGRARRLSSALERAGIELRPGEFIVIAGAASIALALIASLLVGPIGGLLVALLCFFGFRQVVSAKAARRSKAFV